MKKPTYLPLHALVCSGFVRLIEWVRNLHLRPHFERCGVANHCSASPGSYFFGWHTSLLVFLHNRCHIMGIWTTTLVYPRSSSPQRTLAAALLLSIHTISGNIPPFWYFFCFWRVTKGVWKTQFTRACVHVHIDHLIWCTNDTWFLAFYPSGA